ncbi:MAG: E22 family MetX-like putative esterase [Beijerinckiaceae bacterium]
MIKSVAIAATAFLLCATSVHAQAPAAAAPPPMIVEKKVFEMPSLTTLGGKTIANVKVGWQSAGVLNADRSNAILITHFFSGNSHAFGKYKAEDAAAGYWDGLIGPGKAIDTNKYFVLSSDTLVNLNTGMPTVTTTGPASTNPATGKPYGMSFPVVGVGDFVNVQKALVESLGIRKLHTVMGASMGALQAYDWAARYPSMVDRIIPVIGAAEASPWLIAWLDAWASPIRLDPKWNGGDYYGKEPPNAGLADALKLVSLHANHWEWAQKSFGRSFAEGGKDPAVDMANRYRIETFLNTAGAARAKVSDANHFLYLVSANQTFAPGGAQTVDEAAKKIKARTLLLYAPGDQVFPADWIKATEAALKANGTAVESMEIPGANGHLNGVIHMTPMGPKITEFLAK